MKCLKHLARSVKHLIRLDKQTDMQKKTILPSNSTEDLSEAERLERSNLETEDVLVSFAAVIRVVTQRFSPTNGVSGGEALRDDPSNGCEGD